MNALPERLTANEKKYFTKNGLFNMPAYLDYQRYLLQEWGLEEYPLPYNEIDDAEYITRGFYERD